MGMMRWKVQLRAQLLSRILLKLVLAKAIKPQLSKPPAGEVEDSSKVKITPSPAPKPKPKPTVRTKKPPEGTSSFPHSQTCCGNVNRE